MGRILEVRHSYLEEVFAVHHSHYVIHVPPVHWHSAIPIDGMKGDGRNEMGWEGGSDERKSDDKMVCRDEKSWTKYDLRYPKGYVGSLG